MLRTIAVMLALLLAFGHTPSAIAQNCDKPGAMCGGNKNKRGAGTGGTSSGIKGTETPSGNGPSSAEHMVIVDKDRTIIREHFGTFIAAGNCPPGLAKKNNGCLPPGQAKNWTAGQAVPAGVTIHPLPNPLLGRLTPPPAGYRYGRIDGDVVLLSIQTNVVVDGFTFLN
jgi:Ni/Co efflux regulator RcnB